MIQITSQVERKKYSNQWMNKWIQNLARFVYQLASICLQLSPISITTGVLSRHLASLYMHWLFFLVRARLCNHNTHTLTGFDSLFHHFSYVGFHTVQWVSLMICIQTGWTGLSTCIQVTGFFPLGVRLASIQKKKKRKKVDLNLQLLE